MIVRYYKFEDTGNLIGGGTRYVELSDRRALREVSICGAKFLGSNVYYPHWGMLLSHCELDLEGAEGVLSVTREEFELKWAEHLSHDAGRWALIQQAYPVGTQVHGRIEVFYPQGVIVHLGDGGTLGIADYDSAKASAGPDCMYSRHRISAVVQGYDQYAHWLRLESPQVHEDRVPDPYWWV